MGFAREIPNHSSGDTEAIDKLLESYAVHIIKIGAIDIPVVDAINDGLGARVSMTKFLEKTVTILNESRSFRADVFLEFVDIVGDCCPQVPVSYTHLTLPTKA